MAKADDPWRKATGRHANPPKSRAATSMAAARSQLIGESVGCAVVAPRPRTGVRMKRGNQFTGVAGAAGTAKGTSLRLDGVVDADAAADRDGAAPLREAVRETELLGAFDARAIKELRSAAPTDDRLASRCCTTSLLRRLRGEARRSMSSSEATKVPAPVLPVRKPSAFSCSKVASTVLREQLSSRAS